MRKGVISSRHGINTTSKKFIMLCLFFVETRTSIASCAHFCDANSILLYCYLLHLLRVRRGEDIFSLVHGCRGLFSTFECY
ncbi:unnamed protein product [Amoebophrya sp. A25]|nr:unnamed protein product [Amoebophrya sp. A25]|eukprot:GSA25T00010498001.1